MQKSESHEYSEMNIVKWIKENEITVFVENPADLGFFEKCPFKLYKHPKNGTRLCDRHFYIRYKSDIKYSSGPYEFPDNPVLERLCLYLNEIGFIFWSTFKTEIAPKHFMDNMQRLNKLKSSFQYIEAGEESVKTKHYKHA